MNSGEAFDNAASMEPEAAIEACRTRGEHRADPVRFRFIEALARRAADRDGAARRILDARLAQLLAAYRADIERAAEPPRAPRAQHRGPLAQLVDDLTGRASPRESEAPARGAASDPSPLSELKTLSEFRDTWSRLRTHQRLTRSLASVPKNAGPLNSHHLVHRSLTTMRELSPEYLDRFMSYVDALLWLDQAKDAGRAPSPAKPTRIKPG